MKEKALVSTRAFVNRMTPAFLIDQEGVAPEC